MISVILPVFNTEKYVKQAIDSILNQTYKNFELIVIDDCSTDNTKNILLSYDDSRIKIIWKDINSGYVESLNRGIKLARGIYIARMDADDIAHPDRFKKQLSYMISHPEVSVLACHIKLINHNNEFVGTWKNDIRCKTVESIRKTIPYENCICHPSVMMKQNIFDKFLYNLNQYGSEDWDLWMRLIRNGFIIDKINEDLLYYRQSDFSVSAKIDKSIGVLEKANRVRLRYMQDRIKERDIKYFDFLVLHGILRTSIRIFIRKIKK